jgi:hypothetical protein
MEPAIVQLIRRDIGGDHQRIAAKQTQYLAITFKHLLLPIWVAHFRYQQTLYQILVNGRTGKISGERPWSAWKIARLILLILAAVVLIGVALSAAKGSGNGGRRTEASPSPRPAVIMNGTPGVKSAERMPCRGSFWLSC